jgi:hypothetical protein
LKIITKISGCLLVPLFLLSTLLFSGNVYYVDGTNGNDQDNGLSLQTAWRTIGKANRTLRAGDTVYIRGGTYRENDNNSCIRPRYSGNAGNPITYSNYNNEEVIVTDIFLGIFIDQSYIRVNGITIDGGSESSPSMDLWVRLFGSYNTIQNCTMRYAACSDFFQGIRIESNSHHNRILNNVLHHVGEPQPPAPNDRGNAVELIGNYNLVDGNDISYSGHDLVYVSGQYNIIRNNNLHNHWGRCLTLSGSNHVNRHNVVENNRISYATHRDEGVLPNSGMEVFQAYAIIRHNRFYNNWGHGVQLISDYERQPSYDKIYHNVFYHNGYHPSPTVSGIGYGIRIAENEPSGGAFRGVAIKNNIFYDNRFGTISWGSGTNPDDHTVENNFQSGNPLFMNLSEYNFQLKPQSPCIDNGGPLTRTRSSGNSNQIPVEDAGYFSDGHGLVEADYIQLQGEKQVAQIISIDTYNHVITVDKTLTWEDGQGVCLLYSGQAPDCGAHEFGTGSTNYGVYRTGRYWLDTDWDSKAEIVRSFGNAGDIPITGDWDGDGTTNYGVFRPSNAKFYLDTDWDDKADIVRAFGAASDIPVTGDWDGDGTTNYGVCRDSKFYLDTDWDDKADIVRAFGTASDIPVTGDWDGDGTTNYGVFREGQFWLDTNWDSKADIIRPFGDAYDIPITGDWDGNWTTNYGVYRPGTCRFYFDTNWDSQVDFSKSFGTFGDTPVSGNWGS